jgi:uncharacterized protein (DUF1330 family)
MSTIDGDIDSVNHIGVAVRSLNRAAECYEALGFTSIQAARQASAREPRS